MAKEQEHILIYETENGQIQIDVRLEEDTVWLNQDQMTELFSQTKQNISLHIRNIYKEGELDEISTVKEYLTVEKRVREMFQESSNTTIWILLFLWDIELNLSEELNLEYG